MITAKTLERIRLGGKIIKWPFNSLGHFSLFKKPRGLQLHPWGWVFYL
jgi:hypothetical protein